MLSTDRDWSSTSHASSLVAVVLVRHRKSATAAGHDLPLRDNLWVLVHRWRTRRSCT